MPLIPKENHLKFFIGAIRITIDKNAILDPVKRDWNLTTEFINFIKKSNIWEGLENDSNWQCNWDSNYDPYEQTKPFLRSITFSDYETRMFEVRFNANMKGFKGEVFKTPDQMFKNGL